MPRVKHIPPRRIHEFVRKIEVVPERAAHQGRAAHQEEKSSVKLQGRGASEASGALGFSPRTCMNPPLLCIKLPGRPSSIALAVYLVMNVAGYG